MDSSEEIRLGELAGILFILLLCVVGCLIVAIVECCKCESGQSCCQTGCGKKETWMTPSMDGTWR